MKYYDVTIQMKPLCLYLHMVLFVFQYFTKWNWKFGRNLLLARFGSERVNGVKMKHTLMTVTLDA